MENLIYDRNSYDVEQALNNPESIDCLKGSYNYTDLNRIESWCEYLMNILMNYGYAESLVIKTNWNLKDFPTRRQIDRIRGNIDSLKNFCYALTTETIIYNNTISYEQANALEKIIFDIDKYIKDISIILKLPYKFGTVLIHDKFITLSVIE